MYNKGIRWQLHNGDNPAVGITEFTEHPRERVLQPNEVERLFRALDTALNHRDIKTTLNVYVRTARAAELAARQKAHKLMLARKEATPKFRLVKS